MEKFTIAELSKLRMVCVSRARDDAMMQRDGKLSDVEKALAELDEEWMDQLSAKLERVIQSDALRIAVRR